MFKNEKSIFWNEISTHLNLKNGAQFIYDFDMDGFPDALELRSFDIPLVGK